MVAPTPESRGFRNARKAEGPPKRRSRLPAEAKGGILASLSRQNVELMRSLYNGFGPLAHGSDVASYVAAHYSPDCEYHPVEEEEPVRGREAMIGWIQRWFEVWDEMEADVDEILEPRNGLVMTAVTAHGRGTASNVRVDQRFFHVCDMRDGKVLRMREYLERDQALEAAGIKEDAS